MLRLVHMRMKKPLMMIQLLLLLITMTIQLPIQVIAKPHTAQHHRQPSVLISGFINPLSTSGVYPQHQQQLQLPSPSSSLPHHKRGHLVLTWAKKKKRDSELARFAELEAKSKGKKAASSDSDSTSSKTKKKKSSNSKAVKEARAPVFTARIVILGAPDGEWGNGVRTGLIEEGWLEDRVQVLPLPNPAEYPEIKWMAYLREGIKLRNATFVIAGPMAASPIMRFLEKHPLRGTILIGPTADYEGRKWAYESLRQHCPFFGLIYPSGPRQEQDMDSWSPSSEADEVREGLGLAPYPLGIRATPEGGEARAIGALIRDWQFLESLGMGPIQLVGQDDEEEEKAAAAAAATKKEGKAGAKAKQKKQTEEDKR